jgi:hypothetical protein
MDNTKVPEEAAPGVGLLSQSNKTMKKQDQKDQPHGIMRIILDNCISSMITFHNAFRISVILFKGLLLSRRPFRAFLGKTNVDFFIIVVNLWLH